MHNVIVMCVYNTVVDPGFSKRGGTQAYGKNICALARENFFYPALANQLTCKLSCITVILISGHTKKGGGGGACA